MGLGGIETELPAGRADAVEVTEQGVGLAAIPTLVHEPHRQLRRPHAGHGAPGGRDAGTGHGGPEKGQLHRLFPVPVPGVRRQRHGLMGCAAVNREVRRHGSAGGGLGQPGVKRISGRRAVGIDGALLR